MTVRAVRTPLVLALDALWGFALAAIVVAAITGGKGVAPSLATVAAVVVGSWALSRGLQETDLDEGSMRRLGVAVSAVALFAILHFEYAATTAPWDFAWLRPLMTEPVATSHAHRGAIPGGVVLIVLWLRGAAAGQQPLEYDGVLGRTALGLGAMVIAAVFSPDTHGPDIFGPLALLYLVLALAALALFQAPEPDVPVTRFVSRWAGGVGVVLGAAALLALIAAALDPSSLGVLAPVARPLGDALDLVGRYIIEPLLAGPIWLLRLIVPSAHQQPQAQIPQPPQLPPQHDVTRPLWQQALGWAAAASVFAVLAGVLFALLWFAYRRFSKRKPAPSERREQVERDVTLADDLGALWDNFARRFRRSQQTPGSAVEVERLYHEMLADAAAGGLERPAPATPLQFAPPLEAHYASSVASDVSAAFSASRYGQIHPDKQTSDALRARWLDVRKRRGGGE